MRVAGSGPKQEPGPQQPAQPIGDRRAAFRDPDRVRDHHGIRSRDRVLVAQGFGEMRAADLFLQLPEKPDVNRDTVLHRIATRQQGRQGGPFVVRGAPTVIDPLALPEGEGRLPPFGLLGRLYVQMIVNRDGRVPGAGRPSTRHHRIAAGLHDPRLGPQVLEELDGQQGRASDIRGVGRVHADRRQFDHLSQHPLEAGPGLLNIRVQPLVMPLHVLSLTARGDRPAERAHQMNIV